MASRLTCYTRERRFPGHVSRFRLPPGHATPLQVAFVHRTFVPCGYPLPRGPHVQRRPSCRAALAPELVTRFPPKGIRAYSTRPGYMNQDSGYVAGSLKEPGRRASAGLSSHQRDVGRKRSCPDSCDRRWAYPWRDASTRHRTSPFTESDSTCEPSFGLAYLVGARTACG